MMVFFNFGKKESGESKEAMQHIESIQVLGGGCRNCHLLLDAAKSAARTLDINCPVEYITDMQTIMASGVMRTPALMINGKIVSSGRVLKASEIEKLLRG